MPLRKGIGFCQQSEAYSNIAKGFFERSDKKWMEL